MNITYIFPTKIESNDRLKNIITSVSYLLHNFPDAKVLVNEVDTESVFSEQALPKISQLISTGNLIHIFEKSDDPIFHKTKILNDSIIHADTDVICSHDVDVVYPKESHQTAYDLIINDEADIVYPYGCGAFQYQVNYSQQLFEDFTESFDISKLTNNCRLQASSIGWTQFYSKKAVISGGMWNENFLSWGEEDSEFYFRFSLFGYRIQRILNYIYHFEHERTHNSHYHNPKYRDNHDLWQWIRRQDKDTLEKYYLSQNYLKERFQNVSI